MSRRSPSTEEVSRSHGLVVGVALALLWLSTSCSHGSQSHLTVTAVPLPREENVIRTFFNLIDVGRAADAVGMMTDSLAGNEASRQQWTAQFNAIESLEVESIQAFDRDRWTNDEHEFRVELEVHLRQGAATAPIPDFGWQDGQNVRWVTIKQIGKLWAIAAIGSGP